MDENKLEDYDEEGDFDINDQPGDDELTEEDDGDFDPNDESFDVDEDSGDYN